MFDQISIIESFKKAYHLSDQDRVHLHDYFQALHKYVRKPVTIRQEKSDPGSARFKWGLSLLCSKPLILKVNMGHPNTTQ